MKILALDSSQLQASVALIDGDKIIRSRSGSTSVSHSESLLVLVHEVLAGAKAATCDALAVGIGPGSFTGIRIGMATIKALAQAADRPVLGFSSLRALEASVDLQDATSGIVTFVNAYQGLVFAGWSDEQGVWREEALSAADWCRREGRGKAHLFCGTGAKKYWTDIVSACGPHQTLSPIEFASAEGIAAEVTRELARGTSALKPAHEVQARYLRPPQAELNLAAARR